MMLAFVTTLLAFVGWGFNDAVAIKLFRQNDPAKITVASGLFCIAGWLLLMPFFVNQFGLISLKPVVYNLIAGLTSGLGYYLPTQKTAAVKPWTNALASSASADFNFAEE